MLAGKWQSWTHDTWPLGSSRTSFGSCAGPGTKDSQSQPPRAVWLCPNSSLSLGYSFPRTLRPLDAKTYRAFPALSRGTIDWPVLGGGVTAGTAGTGSVLSAFAVALTMLCGSGPLCLCSFGDTEPWRG